MTPWAGITRSYRFVDYATQTYLLLVGALILFFHNESVPNFQMLLLAHGAGILVIHAFIVGSARRPENRFFSFFRHFYPLIALFVPVPGIGAIESHVRGQVPGPCFHRPRGADLRLSACSSAHERFSSSGGQRILLHELLFILRDDRGGGAGTLFPGEENRFGITSPCSLLCSMCAFLPSSSCLWPDRLHFLWRSQGFWISINSLTIPLNFRRALHPVRSLI